MLKFNQNEHKIYIIIIKQINLFIIGIIVIFGGNAFDLYALKARKINEIFRVSFLANYGFDSSKFLAPII